MLLVMIRHGESTENEHGRLSGQIDSDLSARGCQQARALAERLRHAVFDQIYSSDLKRAANTAAPIAASHCLTVDQQQWLRERHAGLLQGLTKKQRKAQYPDLQRAWKSTDPNQPMAGGAENIQDFTERVITGIKTLALQHANQTVLLVTHAGVIREVFNFVFDSHHNGNRIRCGNTAISQFRCDSGLWSMECWGDIAHLQSCPDESVNPNDRT